MISIINAGLIECNASTVPYELDLNGGPSSLYLKKVLVSDNLQEHLAKINYPQAELVRDTNAIFDDKTIELVIVSGSRHHCLPIVEQALKAGKQVRLME